MLSNAQRVLGKIARDINVVCFSRIHSCLPHQGEHNTLYHAESVKHRVLPNKIIAYVNCIKGLSIRGGISNRAV